MEVHFFSIWQDCDVNVVIQVALFPTIVLIVESAAVFNK